MWWSAKSKLFYSKANTEIVGKKILPVEYWLQTVDHEAAGPLQKFEDEHF